MFLGPRMSEFARFRVEGLGRVSGFSDKVEVTLSDYASFFAVAQGCSILVAW